MIGLKSKLIRYEESLKCDKQFSILIQKPKTVTNIGRRVVREVEKTDVTEKKLTQQ